MSCLSLKCCKIWNSHGIWHIPKDPHPGSELGFLVTIASLENSGTGRPIHRLQETVTVHEMYVTVMRAPQWRVRQ